MPRGRKDLPPGPGRPKGIPNKSTSLIRDAFVQAFEKRGGVKALLEWANENPELFYKLCASITPREMNVTGANGGPIETHIKVSFVGNSTDKKS
jgi:hypothetical protein